MHAEARCARSAGATSTSRKRRLTIERGIVQRGGELIEKDTKTHQVRRVSLDEATLAVLEQHRDRCQQLAAECGAELTGDSYLFSHEVDFSQPWRPNYATLAFGRLRDKLDLDGVKLHHLRHFSATQLLSLGIDVRTVSGRLGHANASTTLDIYAQFVEQSDEKAADALGALLDGSSEIGGQVEIRGRSSTKSLRRSGRTDCLTDPAVWDRRAGRRRCRYVALRCANKRRSPSTGRRGFAFFGVCDIWCRETALRPQTNPISVRWPVATTRDKNHQSVASNDSAVGRQPGEHFWSEPHLVGNLAEAFDAFDHAYAGEKIDEPVPRVVVASPFGIVRKNHRPDVALDPRRCHVLPDVSLLATVNSGREAPLRVQDDLGPVIEHRVLADTEAGLASRRVLQLTQGTKPHDCHVA